MIEKSPTILRRQIEKGTYITPDGEFPSVTKVIGWVFNGGKSDALVPWAVKQTCDFLLEELEQFDGTGKQYPEFVLDTLELARKEAAKKKDEASDVGSYVHSLIHDWAILVMANDPKAWDVPPFAPERVKTAFGAFLDWAREHELEPLRAELVVYSKELKCAGTLDMVAKFRPSRDEEKALYILDFKTSNYFYDVPNGCQLAAYQRMHRELYPGDERVERIGVVRLDRETGKPHFRCYTDKTEQYLETFAMFRLIYGRWKEKGEVKSGRTGKGKRSKAVSKP